MQTLSANSWSKLDASCVVFRRVGSLRGKREKRKMLLGVCVVLVGGDAPLYRQLFLQG